MTHLLFKRKPVRSGHVAGYYGSGPETREARRGVAGVTPRPVHHVKGFDTPHYKSADKDYEVTQRRVDSNPYDDPAKKRKRTRCGKGLANDGGACSKPRGHSGGCSNPATEKYDSEDD
jgi:hypothetical protein